MRNLLFLIFLIINSSCARFSSGSFTVNYWGNGIYEFKTSSHQVIANFGKQGRARYFMKLKPSRGFTSGFTSGSTYIQFLESKPDGVKVFDIDKVLGPDFNIEKDKKKFNIMRLKSEKTFENIIGSNQ